MIVNIEMYFEYVVGDITYKFRSFVPQKLEHLMSNGKPSWTHIEGQLNTIQCAHLIVDLSNRRVTKDRMGKYVRCNEVSCTSIPVSVDDVNAYRKQPVIDYREMISAVEILFNPHVTEFKGDMHFLSNFYPAEFVWNHFLWPNSEAAYQAAKTNDPKVWSEFARQSNPYESKRLGKRLDIRPDWEKVKVKIMRDIVFEKFNQNPELRKKLLATGNAVLEEGNTWRDTFWGICPPGSGNGENHLGKILMDVRLMLSVLEF